MFGQRRLRGHGCADSVFCASKGDKERVALGVDLDAPVRGERLAEDALMVGNSIRSDIEPALAAGVQPIWIDAHVWEYEHSDDRLDDQIIALHDLSELVEVAS